MNNSIEITSKTPLNRLSDYKDVFITWLPFESFDSILNKVKEIKKKGHNPIPHIAVRKIHTKEELIYIKNQLKQYTNTILLIRGSGKQEGTFNNVNDVISTRIFNNFKIGVAGFPEGNNNLTYQQSLSILKEKTYADFVVTHWSLNKQHIKRFLDDSSFPIYLGLPNKCSLSQLFNFAKICGIENSIKYSISNSKTIIKLMINGFDPSDIVKEFKNHRNLKGFHYYNFGQIK